MYAFLKRFHSIPYQRSTRQSRPRMCNTMCTRLHKTGRLQWAVSFLPDYKKAAPLLFANEIMPIPNHGYGMCIKLLPFYGRLVAFTQTHHCILFAWTVVCCVYDVVSMICIGKLGMKTSRKLQRSIVHENECNFVPAHLSKRKRHTHRPNPTRKKDRERHPAVDVSSHCASQKKPIDRSLPWQALLSREARKGAYGDNLSRCWSDACLNVLWHLTTGLHFEARQQ